MAAVKTEREQLRAATLGADAARWTAPLVGLIGMGSVAGYFAGRRGTRLSERHLELAEKDVAAKQALAKNGGLAEVRRTEFVTDTTEEMKKPENGKIYFRDGELASLRAFALDPESPYGQILVTGPFDQMPPVLRRLDSAGTGKTTLVYAHFFDLATNHEFMTAELDIGALNAEAGSWLGRQDQAIKEIEKMLLDAVNSGQNLAIHITEAGLTKGAGSTGSNLADFQQRLLPTIDKVSKELAKRKANGKKVPEVRIYWDTNKQLTNEAALSSRLERFEVPYMNMEEAKAIIVSEQYLGESILVEPNAIDALVHLSPVTHDGAMARRTKMLAKFLKRQAIASGVTTVTENFVVSEVAKSSGLSESQVWKILSDSRRAVSVRTPADIQPVGIMDELIATEVRRSRDMDKAVQLARPVEQTAASSTVPGKAELTVGDLVRESLRGDPRFEGRAPEHQDRMVRTLSAFASGRQLPVENGRIPKATVDSLFAELAGETGGVMKPQSPARPVTPEHPQGVERVEERRHGRRGGKGVKGLKGR